MRSSRGVMLSGTCPEEGPANGPIRSLYCRLAQQPMPFFFSTLQARTAAS